MAGDSLLFTFTFQPLQKLIEAHAGQRHILHNFMWIIRGIIIFCACTSSTYPLFTALTCLDLLWRLVGNDQQASHPVVNAIILRSVIIL